MKPLLLALAVGMAGCAHGPCMESTYMVKPNGGDWKSVDLCLYNDGTVRWREGR